VPPYCLPGPNGVPRQPTTAARCRSREVPNAAPLPSNPSSSVSGSGSRPLSLLGRAKRRPLSEQPSAVRWTGAERRRLSPGPARPRCGRASRDRRDSTVPSSDLRHPVLENTGSQSSDARWGKMLRSPDPNDELDRPLDLEGRTDLLAPRFLLERV